MSFVIFLGSSCGQKVPLEVEVMATVADIRKAAVAAEVSRAERCGLMYGEQEIQDHQVLADLGIGPEATVQMLDGPVFKWVSTSEHSSIEENLLKYGREECTEKCPKDCGSKCGAVLAPSEDFEGFTSGIISWKLKFGQTKTNSAAGVGEKSSLSMSHHFNSTGSGNGPHCWMWYAGGRFYHNGENSTIKLGSEGPSSSSLTEGTEVEFVLDLDVGELRGKMNGKELAEPLATELKGKCLLPYVELQTVNESVTYLPADESAR